MKFRFDLMGGLDSPDFLKMIRELVDIVIENEAIADIETAPAHVRAAFETLMGTRLASFPMPLRPLLVNLTVLVAPSLKELAQNDEGASEAISDARLLMMGATVTYEYLQRKRKESTP